MSRDTDSGMRPDRRTLLRSIGALGAGATFVGTASGADSGPELAFDETLLDAVELRDSVERHAGPLLERLTDRGLVERATPEALGVREVVEPTAYDGAETQGTVGTVRVDGETYAAVHTTVGTDAGSARVFVAPDAGHASAIVTEGGERTVLTVEDGSTDEVTLSDSDCEDNCTDAICDCPGLYAIRMNYQCCETDDGEHCYHTCDGNCKKLGC